MQVFLPHDGAAAIVGVVGALQLDVLTERLNAEYGLPVSFEQSRFEICRWVASDEKGELEKFVSAYPRLDRRRSRRRAGLHGEFGVQPALRAGALAEDPLRRREGLPEGGGVSRSLTPRFLSATIALAAASSVTSVVGCSRRQAATMACAFVGAAGDHDARRRFAQAVDRDRHHPRIDRMVDEARRRRRRNYRGGCRSRRAPAVPRPLRRRPAHSDAPPRSCCRPPTPTTTASSARANS